MSIFRSHKDITGYPDTEPVTLSTVFDSFSLSMIPFAHSRKFYEDGRDPEGEERKRLKGKSYDWLLANKRDAVFEADSRAEIVYLKQQHTNHERAILPLLAKNKGQLAKAKKNAELIEKEIEMYIKLENEILGEDKHNA